MTTMTAGGRVPEFTLGWRMRLALETGGISVQEMAERLGYSRSTISRWLNDQDPPRAGIKALWCLETGVDLKWLETGEGGPTPTPGPGKPSGNLAKLTESKRRRTHGGSTRQYLVPAVQAA